MTLRSTTLLAAPLLAALLLAGCTATPAITPEGNGDNSDTPTEEASDTPDAPELVEGEAAPPGTKVGFDTYLAYPFITTDDTEALLSAKLDSIEIATAEEMAFLTENFGSQLDGFDVYMLRMTEKKVSGADVTFNSDYSYFRPVKEDGERVQPVTLIGWDGCATESFTKEYEAGAELAQCFMGAVPNGQPAPAGMAFTGGYEDDNPYDALDGKPLLFIP